jgi:3-hydroxybutyryl-CoA dehydrogenase
MGSGIAEVAARAGFEVLVRSRSQASADACITKVERSLSRQVDKGKLSAQDRDATLSQVRAVTDLEELELCDLVIESVIEDLEVKKQLFADLDRRLPQEAVLATNTSTFPVVELAMATSHPERVCGLHFFNPAPVMPLVEVVPALTTSPETTSAAEAFAVECGKSPVTVKDEAGFVVNALLFPFLNSAVRMLEGGVASMEDIDAAMRGGCGFPMGPFQLLDLVGLDTSVAILNALYQERRDPACAASPLLRRMVMAQRLGRKTGKGFYDYPPAGSPAAR